MHMFRLKHFRTFDILCHSYALSKSGNLYRQAFSLWHSVFTLMLLMANHPILFFSYI